MATIQSFTPGQVLTAAQLTTLQDYIGVVQVKSVTKSDAFSASSATYTDVTGLSVSITPTSATNKVLVFYSLTGAGLFGSSLGLVQLVRDSTAIAIGDTAGSRLRASGVFMALSTNDMVTVAGQFLDSPATTSATTYKIQVRSFATQLTTVNRSQTDGNSTSYVRTVSSVTVMEVTP